MFGKDTSVSSLTARKQLLIAESNLNRTRLLQDWKSVASGWSDISQRTQSLRGIASCALSLLEAGDPPSTRTRSRVSERSSWGDILIPGTRLASDIWQHFHPRNR